MKINTFFVVSFFVLILVVFRNWFSNAPLSSGDWGYYYPQALSDFPRLPSVWDPYENLGFGQSSLFTLSIGWFFTFSGNFFSTIFHIPWEVIEKIVWFWPFLIISVFSSIQLGKYVLKNNFFLITAFIFLFNTYSLMLVGGGQMGVALSYSLSPLVFTHFLKFIDIALETEQKTYSLIKSSILGGLFLAILSLFDIRVTYIIVLGICIYLIFVLSFKNKFLDFKKYSISFFFIFLIPFLVALTLHSFLIFPSFLFPPDRSTNPLFQFNSLGGVKFFSFAELENSISLLQPNWPENIFGKVGFMKSEFLGLPLLAYSSILFIKNKKYKTRDMREKRNQRMRENFADERKILYFTALGIIGSFLAKGTNDPGGFIYLWMFSHIPGFIMFRDPTKWYVLIALSYSILIPFTLSKCYSLLCSQFPKEYKFISVSNVLLVTIFLYLLFLIRPALSGEVGGTFKKRFVPNEYVRLAQFLSTQNNFFRTLWVPEYQRYGFNTSQKRAISGKQFLKKYTIDDIAVDLKRKNTQRLLTEAGVEYVIVPFDSNSEIFLKDRVYDEKQYEKLVLLLRKNSFLKEIDGFGNIKIFKTQTSNDHFWSPSANVTIQNNFFDPSHYKVTVKNAKINDTLIFSEQFDNGWVLKSSNSTIHPFRYKLFDAFQLPMEGDNTLDVVYIPQSAVNIGSYISILSLFGILLFLFYEKNK